MSEASQDGSRWMLSNDDRMRLPWRGWVLYFGAVIAYAALTAGVVFAITGAPSRWMLFGLAGGHFVGCSAIGGTPSRYRNMDTDEILTLWAGIQPMTRGLFALIGVVVVGLAAGAPFFLDNPQTHTQDAAPAAAPKPPPISPGAAPKPAATSRGPQHH